MQPREGGDNWPSPEFEASFSYAYRFRFERVKTISPDLLKSNHKKKSKAFLICPKYSFLHIPGIRWMRYAMDAIRYAQLCYVISLTCNPDKEIKSARNMMSTDPPLTHSDKTHTHKQTIKIPNGIKSGCIRMAHRMDIKRAVGELQHLKHY